jgi:hypothetical protein
MTYSELYDAILSYTENYSSEFEAAVPTFVRQTETRVYNAVSLPSLRKNQYGTLSANNKYLSTPVDFLSVYSMAVIQNFGLSNEVYTYLLNKDVNFIREAYPTPNDTGVPGYYAIFGPTVTSNVITTEVSLILGPTPNNSYTVELHYNYYPTSIVDAGTSWLGDNYDPVLLYGSLREAYLFMKGEQDLIANVEAKYNEALGE